MDMSEDAQKDGGQAFPASGNHGQHVPGMTLRDYLAAQAMPAYLAHVSCGGTEMISRYHDEIATESYKIADAMMLARAVAHKP